MLHVPLNKRYSSALSWLDLCHSRTWAIRLAKAGHEGAAGARLATMGFTNPAGWPFMLCARGCWDNLKHPQRATCAIIVSEVL